MKLFILGSSSSGNAYLLQSETTGQVLAIEAGIRFSKVKKALDFNIGSIAGCIISHEHGDHAKYAHEYVKACIPVYTSMGTAQATGLVGSSFVHTLHSSEPCTIGDFKVIPFDVEHDAAEPFGYLIRHHECGDVLFATDTYYLKYRFPGLSNMLLECNYRQDILDHNIEAGLVSPAIRARIIKSHMSYDTCLETLQANDLSKINNIVLIHLSSDNSHADEFVAGISKATGKHVLAAAKDMVIDFNKTPY